MSMNVFNAFHHTLCHSLMIGIRTQWMIWIDHLSPSSTIYEFWEIRLIYLVFDLPFGMWSYRPWEILHFFTLEQGTSYGPTGMWIYFPIQTNSIHNGTYHSLLLFGTFLVGELISHLLDFILDVVALIVL